MADTIEKMMLIKSVLDIQLNGNALSKGVKRIIMEYIPDDDMVYMVNAGKGKCERPNHTGVTPKRIADYNGYHETWWTIHRGGKPKHWATEDIANARWYVNWRSCHQKLR